MIKIHRDKLGRQSLEQQDVMEEIMAAILLHKTHMPKVEDRKIFLNKLGGSRKRSLKYNNSSKKTDDWLPYHKWSLMLHGEDDESWADVLSGNYLFTYIHT